MRSSRTAGRTVPHSLCRSVGRSLAEDGGTRDPSADSRQAVATLQEEKTLHRRLLLLSVRASILLRLFQADRLSSSAAAAVEAAVRRGGIGTQDAVAGAVEQREVADTTATTTAPVLTVVGFFSFTDDDDDDAFDEIRFPSCLHLAGGVSDYYRGVCRVSRYVFHSLRALHVYQVTDFPSDKAIAGRLSQWHRTRLAL